MKTGVKFVSAGLAVLTASSVWAWGAGHDTVGRCLLRRLPDEWQAKFKSEWMPAYLKATHLPDHGDAKLMKPEDLAWLQANCGLKDDMMPLHHGAPLYGVFERLVHAIRTGDDRSTFVLLASLSHAIADGAACNHDAILHFFDYTWVPEGAPQGKGLPVLPKTGRAMPCEFSFVERYDDTKAILERRLAALEIPEPPADVTSEQVFSLLERWEILSMEVNNQNTGRIIASGAKWFATGDVAARADAADALCNLGLWSVARSLYVFKAARILAARPDFAPMPLDRKLAVAKLKSTNEVEILNRPIENDSFARPYFAEPGRPSRVRVMYSPVDYGARSVFMTGSRPFGCQIVGSLKTKRPELNASIMDARVFAKSGLDPAVTPVIVVFKGFTNYRGFDVQGFERNLRAYAHAGGKVIWINGAPPAYLIGKEVAAAVKDPNRGYCNYCNPQYPVPLDELMQSSLAWVGPGEKREWKYVNRPVHVHGWNWIGSPQYLDTAKLPASAVPLTELRAPGKTFVTGVANGSCAYLPLNAIFSYCLTDERPCLDPFLLQLDSAGEAMVFATIDLLNPQR